MAGSTRVAWGHATVGVGLLVRRVSVFAGGVTFALLALTAGLGAGPDVGPLSTIGLALAVFVGARLLAVALGAVGWVIFPAEHRSALAEIAAESPGPASSDPAGRSWNGRGLPTRHEESTSG